MLESRILLGSLNLDSKKRDLVFELGLSRRYDEDSFHEDEWKWK